MLCGSQCVCERCVYQEPKFLANQCNEILTAIVHGMRKEEPSNNVRLAATKALLNSLEFTKANFEKEVHYNHLPLLPVIWCEPYRMNAILSCKWCVKQHSATRNKYK